MHVSALATFALGALVGCGAAPPSGTQRSLPANEASAALLTLRYQGSGQLEGHFSVPGELRPFSMALEITVGGAVRRLVTTTWTEADAADAESEVTWVDADSGRVLRQRGEGSTMRFDLLEGLEAQWARQLASLGATQPTRALAHPNRGDVIERVMPGEHTTLDGVTGPGSLELEHHAIDLRWTAILQRAPAQVVSSAASLAMPVSQTASQRAPRPLTLEEIAPGVLLAAIPEGDSASLIVELADGLFVAEATLTTALGEQLVDALAARFPQKPVRYVTTSHYHPHYTGGLRALLAAGATVLAPPGLGAHARALAARPFTLAPDRLARAPRAAAIQLFSGSMGIEDANGQRVELFDLGAASNHTQEYVAVYVPRARLLFQGDLGWFVADGGGVRAGRRTAGLLEAIAARGLVVERLAQGWPLMPGKQVISRAELEAAQAARR